MFRVGSRFIGTRSSWIRRAATAPVRAKAVIGGTSLNLAVGVGGDRPLPKYQRMLLERPDACRLIVADYTRALGAATPAPTGTTSSTSLLQFAGGAAEADAVAQIIVRALADTANFDNMRGFFAFHVCNSLPKFSEQLASVYLAALARSDTLTLAELDATVDILKARSTVTSLGASMAIAEMKMRCGGQIDWAQLLAALDATPRLESVDRPRLMRFLRTVYRGTAWTDGALKFLRHAADKETTEPAADANSVPAASTASTSKTVTTPSPVAVKSDSTTTQLTRSTAVDTEPPAWSTLCNAHLASAMMRDAALKPDLVLSAVVLAVAPDIMADDGRQADLTRVLQRFANARTAADPQKWFDDRLDSGPALLRSVRPLVKSSDARSALVVAFGRCQAFDDLFDVLETPSAADAAVEGGGDAPAATTAKTVAGPGPLQWLHELRPISTATADAMYFALERRRTAGQTVSADTLEAVVWACAFSEDEVRVRQTVEAFQAEFKLQPTPGALAALAMADRAAEIF